MEGFRKGASLSAGALLGGPRRGAPFLGIQKDMVSRAQGMNITLCGDPAGEFGRGLIYRGLEKVLGTGTFLDRGPVKNRVGSVHREL